jgi:putative inorganic carbon (HCO3(-)) transporter
MPLLLYLFNTSVNPLTRFALMSGEVLCGVAVIGTYSRGGFLGLLTFALGLIALNRNKIRNFIGVAVAGVVLLQFAPEAWFQRINTIGTAEVDTSFTDRITAWKVSLLIALDRPFFGGGFHAVQDTDVYLKYGKDLARVDFMASAPLRPVGMAAHSIYFEVLGDLGFTGLALFVGMLGLAIQSCSTIRRRARGQADMAWIVDLASMLRLSLIVYMVAGAALSFAYFEGVYVLAALLSVLRRMQAVELGKRALVAPEMLFVEEVETEEVENGWVPGWEQYGSARM